MQIVQSFTVAAPRNRVWAIIRDPAQMVACVPGCESIEQLDCDRYRSMISVSVGPIKARFNLTTEIVEERAPAFMKSLSHGEEGTRASIVRLENDVNLSESRDGGTESSYSTNVEISGRLGRYGAGMMNKIAARLAREFEQGLRALAQAPQHKA
ncbi:MAG: CoxG family protein [Gammaproteobacteria bacterium]